MLKNTLVVASFVGIPLLFSASKISEEAAFLGSIAKRLFGVSAVVTFYVSLGSLPLWGELLLQPVAAFLAAAAVVAHGEPDHRSAERLINSLLALIGVALLAYTTRLAFTSWSEGDLKNAGQSFVLAAWLTVALVPFIYAFAFLTGVGVILAMIPYFNDRVNPPLRVRFACIAGLHFRTKFAASFRGEWRRKIARSRKYRDAQRIMATFRTSARAGPGLNPPRDEQC